MLYKIVQSDDTTFVQKPSLSEGWISHPDLTPIEIIVSQWKDAWYTKFDWIEFHYVTSRIFLQSL